MPKITLTDLSLREHTLTQRVADLKDAYFRAAPEICVERPRLITEFSAEHGFFRQPRISVLDKAKMYRWVLERRTPVIHHTEAHDKQMRPFRIQQRSLFAGSTTSKFKGVPLYPEFMALSLWPELWTLPKRATNPFHITDEEVQTLNEKVFPYWIDSNITELTRKRCFEENLRNLGRRKYAPELQLLQYLVFFLASKPECISHTIPDFSKAVGTGLRGVIEEAQTRRSGTHDAAMQVFYQALVEVLEGIITYSQNLATRARTLAASETDSVAKQELITLAEIHEHVPAYPARSFREALTTVWTCWTAIHLENPNVGLSLGRLDQVLYEAYRRDVDGGTLSIDQALELLCCLWLKVGDHVPAIPAAGEQLFGGTGSNQAITIGGVDAAGQDAVNDLTYVVLRATELMRLRDPNLNARYYAGVNPPQYLRRLCEVNVTTGATPALHNDRAVIKALTAKGETPEQARDYGIIGCVEPDSNGRSYGHSGALLMNLTSVLELTLYNGRHRHTGEILISKETGDPRRFNAYQEFQVAFQEQARWLIEQCTRLNNLLGRIHQDFYPTPILSALFEGPMEKGRDVIQGGAVLNSSGAAIIGLADVADSLSAIQKHVYQDRRISMAELLSALEVDFKGCEALQKLLANPAKTPKYGNEEPLAERNVDWITELMDREFSSIPNYRGGRYRVGYWTMTNHAGFGKLMGALPNGRRAQANFASGITPVSGATPSLTPVLNSVAKLHPEHLSNGIAFNLKYMPEAAHPAQMLDNFVASVEAYFQPRAGAAEGGMEVQFNIIDHATLMDAAEHPENYPELLVRVSGYTAYFKDLNPQMQKEIIERTEYVLSPGTALQFGPFAVATAAG